MTIVFKYPGNVPGGVQSWATVALPYNYSKNLPDLMMFKVEDFQPPTNLAPGNTVTPGATRFPIYRLRDVGGGLSVDGKPPTNPQTEIWGISGIFPTYAPFGRPGSDTNWGTPIGEDLPNPTTNQPFITPPLMGLIGDLDYPTVTDIQTLLNLGLPTPNESNINSYRIPRGPNTFIENEFQQSRRYMIQYHVSSSDEITAASYPTSIAGERTNLTTLLPQSITDSNLIRIEVLEENAIRKVLKVRAMRPIEGFNISTYYYLYKDSQIVYFSTRFNWSHRLGARETHPAATGNYNPEHKIIHQVLGCAEAPLMPISPETQALNKIVEIGAQQNFVNTREWLRVSYDPTTGYIPTNPQTGQTFAFAYKFDGEFEVGDTIYWGPTAGGAGDIKTSFKTSYGRWINEGSGSYWYGVLWNPINNYVWDTEIFQFGQPDGTYIWTKGTC